MCRNISDHTKFMIDQYIIHGIPPGDFLQAVLINDLQEAFARADEHNSANMGNIVAFLYNCVPTMCYKSLEAVANWLRIHREKPEQIAEGIEYYKVVSERYLNEL